uniref:Condensin complex subunit 1 C-terminal domain-containing protein n=1 Tax=Sphenodon punctatus TaxID=8508 RepID=A0A8D0HDR0_SPHPU
MGDEMLLTSLITRKERSCSQRGPKSRPITRCHIPFQMAHPRISARLPPDIDPTKAPIAFGERALPKLNEELQDPELLTRQRALMALCDLVHDPEHVYQAAHLGFLDNLKNLLLDEDSTVRQKTTEVLYIMATHSVGRDGFLKYGVIPALAQLLNDPVDICRWNMHYAFKMMAELPAGKIRLLLIFF